MINQRKANMRTDLRFYRRILAELPPNSSVYQEVWTKAEKLRVRIGDIETSPEPHNISEADAALREMERLEQESMDSKFLKEEKEGEKVE